MKIGIFTPSFLPTVGGVELAVHHVANQLGTMGHDVTVLTFRAGQVSASGNPSYRVVGMPPGLARLKGRLGFISEFAIAARLAQLQLRHHFDVVNVHMAYPGGIAASWFRRFFNVPVVLTCHATDVQVYPELNYGLRLIPGLEPKIKRGIERADLVTAVSDSVADDVKGLAPSVVDVDVIPNGVLAERFRPVSVSMRNRLGIEGDTPIVLTVGRNHPKKGFEDLIRAVGILAETRRNFRCVIAGGGTETLVPLVEELGLGDMVILPGKVPSGAFSDVSPDALPHDELVSLYMESDIFVLPSYIEGLPLVIPEAMMAGLPIVSTDVPGNRDIVEHGTNGYLLEAGDVLGLAGTLDSLLLDSDKREMLSMASREMAKDYDWPIIARAYLDSFGTAIEKMYPSKSTNPEYSR